MGWGTLEEIIGELIYSSCSVGIKRSSQHITEQGDRRVHWRRQGERAGVFANFGVFSNRKNTGEEL